MAPNRFIVVRDQAPDGALRGAVAALGNFDGVHRGHRAVIGVALERARALGKPAAVISFAPHPRAFFNPGAPMFQLTDEAGKLRLLASTGLDGAILLTFDAALAGLTADEFVARILVGRFAISGAVIGFNFHFGKGRGGSPDFLAAEGRKYGFSVDVVPPFMFDGHPVSSGPIREALASGRVRRCGGFAGLSLVRLGRSRPRRQARPPARISDRQSAARHRLRAAARRLCGAGRGRRPALRRGREFRPAADVRHRRGAARSVSVRLRGDLYGKTIDVAFIEWLRGEEVFASVDDLVVQMKEDSAKARVALERAGDAFPPI